MQGTFLKITTVCLTALVLAACGSDGGSSSGGSGGSTATGGNRNDDGTDGSGGGDGSGEGGPSVTVTTEIGAPGLASSATAKSSKGARFSWELTKQPKGSELSNDDLEDADQATVIFYPQVSGDYELTVTVQVGSETPVRRKVELPVRGYQVPFLFAQFEPKDGDFSVEQVAAMVDSGGGEPREVGCRHSTTETDVATAAFERPFNASAYVPQSLDETARIATRVYSDDGAMHHKIELASEDTRCDAEVGAPVYVHLGHPLTGPRFPFRFSPDGSRLLVVGEGEVAKTLYSADSTTGAPRVLASGDPDWPPHNNWATGDEILVQQVVSSADPPPFQLLVVPDQEDALDEATVILDCDGVEEENAVLPLAQVYLVGESLVILKDTTVYRVDANPNGTFDCEIDSERTRVLAEDVASLDLAKDGTRIVYDSAQQDAVFVASIDGEGEPLRLSPDDGTRHMHPRFALGGAQVVWTSVYDYEPPKEGETTPFEEDVVRVFRVNSDGTRPAVLWQTSAPEDHQLVATTGYQRGTNACTFGLPLSGGSAGFLAFAVGGLVLGRRRRAMSEVNASRG